MRMNSSIITGMMFLVQLLFLLSVEGAVSPHLPVNDVNTIKIIFLKSTQRATPFMLSGAIAAIYNQNKNKGGIRGKKVELVIRNVANNEFANALTTYLDSLTPLEKKQVYAVSGLSTSTSLDEVNPILKANNLLSFGHSVATSNLPKNTLNVFTHTNSYMELMASVQNILVSRRLRRIGLVVVSGRQVGSQRTEKLEELEVLLRGFGLRPAGVMEPYAGRDPSKQWTDALYTENWHRFEEAMPQAVLIFGHHRGYGNKILEDILLKLTLRQRVTVFVDSSSSLQLDNILRTFRNKPEGERIKANATIVIVSGQPTLVGNTPTVIRFKKEYNDTVNDLAVKNEYELYPLIRLEKSASVGILVKAAWTAFQLFFQGIEVAAATRESMNFTSETLRKAFFSQGLFTPGGNDGTFNDVVLGTYSSDCSTLRRQYLPRRDSRGEDLTGGQEECICNQGSNIVEILELDQINDRMFITNSLRSDISSCDPLKETPRQAIILYRPNQVFWAKNEDGSVVSFLKEADEFYSGVVQPFGEPVYYIFTSPYSYDGVDAIIDSHREVQAVQKNNYFTAIGAGPMHVPIHPSITSFVIDPVIQIPVPFLWSKYMRNVISINGIFESEMRALASYIEFFMTQRLRTPQQRRAATFDDIINAPVYLVVDDVSASDGTPIYGLERHERLSKYAAGIMASSLLKFAEPAIYSDPEIPIDVTLDRDFPENTFIFIVGLEMARLPHMVKLMERRKTMRIVLSSTSLMINYDEIKEANYPTEVLERIFFATSLPEWLPPYKNRAQVEPIEEHPSIDRTKPSPSPSSAVQAFYDKTKSKPHLRTPYMMMTYIVEKFLKAAASFVTTPPQQIEENKPFFKQQYTSEALLKAIYGQSYITIDESLSFGPFYDKPCNNTGGSKVDENTPVDAMWEDYDESWNKLVSEQPCEKNWADARMYVRTLAAALGRGATSPVQNPAASTFSIRPSQYPIFPDLPKEPASVLPYIIGFVIGSLVVIIVVIVVLYFCLIRKKGRDVTHAPKDANKPVTIIFTDIQSSTSLWAEIPDTMGPALDAHHALIRDLANKHRGYEVKTIGDSFMLAFSKASDAVAFSYQLQFDFYEYDWGSTVIEESYHFLENARITEILEGGEDDTGMPLAMLPNGGGAATDSVLIQGTTSGRQTGSIHSSDFDRGSKSNDDGPIKITTGLILSDPRTRYFTCNMSAEDYKNSWNGLRVRIGINTGFCEIKLDEITHGYDYYGNLTNVASRTEACAWGGQIIITNDTKKALVLEFGSETKIPYKIVSFGPQPLRGVPEPIELHQVFNVPGRFFGPLRLDCVYAKDAGDDDDDTSGPTGSSDENATVIRDEDFFSGLALSLLTTLFSTVRKKKRTDDLDNLCRSWRLRPSKKRALKMLRANKFMQWRALTKRGLPGAQGTIDFAFLANEGDAKERKFSASSTNSRTQDQDMVQEIRIDVDEMPINEEPYRLKTPKEGGWIASNAGAPTADVSALLDKPESRKQSVALTDKSRTIRSVRSSIANANGSIHAGSMANNSQQGVVLQMEDLMPDDPQLIFLASKIAAVALKQLPRQVKQMIKVGRTALQKAAANNQHASKKTEKDEHGWVF